MKKSSWFFALIVAAVVLGSSAVLYSAEVGPRPKVNFNLLYTKLDKSPQGLAAYKEKVIDLQEEVKARGLKNVHTTITLHEAIPVDSAVELIQKYDVNPGLVYAFARSRDGELLTIAGKFRNKGLQAGLSDLIKDEEAELIGVVSLVAAVHTERLSALQNDDRVFLVDISADENLVQNPNNRDYMHHLAWDLYHHRNPSPVGKRP